MEQVEKWSTSISKAKLNSHSYRLDNFILNLDLINPGLVSTNTKPVGIDVVFRHREFYVGVCQARLSSNS